MKLRELYILSHREITAYRTRSRATIITVGVLFGLLLASLVILQGLENVALKYASSMPNSIVESYTYNEATDGLYTTEAEFYKLNDHQIMTYRWFASLKNKFVRPVSIVLLVVAVFILAFTMSHILSQSIKTSILYRSLGASKSQLLLIYFVYMLQLCCRAIVFAVVVAVVLAGIVTAAGWHYFFTEFAAAYPGASHHLPILFGVNWQCLETISWMLLAVPPSFLLCLDQFSNRKLALKLKGD